MGFWDGVFVDGGDGSAEGLRRGLSFPERWFGWGVGLGEDGFCCGEVFLDVGRGEGEDGTDAFESVPFGVFEESAGVLGIVFDGEEVADGVDVFVSGEAVVGDFGARGHFCGFAFFEAGGDPFDDARVLYRGRAFGLFFWRHLSGVDAFHDLEPLGRVLCADVFREVVDAEVAFLFLGVVAVGAVVLEIGLELFVEIGG